MLADLVGVIGGSYNKWFHVCYIDILSQNQKQLQVNSFFVHIGYFDTFTSTHCNGSHGIIEWDQAPWKLHVSVWVFTPVVVL